MMTRLQPHWPSTTWRQLPLPHLWNDDDDDGGGANRWSFAIVALQRNGRVTLPAAARYALDGCASLRAVPRGEIVLVGPGAAGRPVTIDGRGRLVVPCWLRGAAEPAGSLLVGTRAMRDVEPIVLLAPPRLLAGFADALVGER